MSHFGFLEREWSGVFEAAGKVEAAREAVFSKARVIKALGNRALHIHRARLVYKLYQSRTEILDLDRAWKGSYRGRREERPVHSWPKVTLPPPG